MEIIPYTLAENAGLNAIRMVKGGISDMWEEHVVQPLLVSTSEISLSTECVGMILKIDDLIPVR